MSFPIEASLISTDGEHQWLGNFQHAFEARNACQDHARANLKWAPCTGEVWKWQAVDQHQIYVILKKP